MTYTGEHIAAIEMGARTPKNSKEKHNIINLATVAVGGHKDVTCTCNCKGRLQIKRKFDSLVVLVKPACMRGFLIKKLHKKA